MLGADKRLPDSVVEVEVVANGAERMRRVCAWPGSLSERVGCWACQRKKARLS